MKAADLAAALLALPPNTEIYVYNGEFCILSPAILLAHSFEVSIHSPADKEMVGHMAWNNDKSPDLLGEGYEYRDIHWIGSASHAT